MIVIAIFSFVLGRLSAYQKEFTQDYRQIEKEDDAKLSSHQDLKKDSNLSQQSVFIQKHYSNKGKLVDVTMKTTISTNVVLENLRTEQKLSTSSKVEQKEVLSHRPQWILGSDYDVQGLGKFDPKNLDFRMGHSLFENFYMVGSANYQLTKVTIGVEILF